jgi:hypothetical protein
MLNDAIPVQEFRLEDSELGVEDAWALIELVVIVTTPRTFVVISDKAAGRWQKVFHYLSSSGSCLLYE